MWGGYQISIAYYLFSFVIVMIFNFWTDRSGQTVQTQIRLLLQEQSDQGLYLLLIHLCLFNKILKGLASLFEFRFITAKFSGN